MPELAFDISGQATFRQRVNEVYAGAVRACRVSGTSLGRDGLTILRHTLNEKLTEEDCVVFDNKLDWFVNPDNAKAAWNILLKYPLIVEPGNRQPCGVVSARGGSVKFWVEHIILEAGGKALPVLKAKTVQATIAGHSYTRGDKKISVAAFVRSYKVGTHTPSRYNQTLRLKTEAVALHTPALHTPALHAESEPGCLSLKAEDTSVINQYLETTAADSKLLNGRRLSAIEILIPIEEKKAKYRQGSRSDLKTPSCKRGKRSESSASHVIGRILHCSASTVAQVKKILTKPEYTQKVKEGKLSISAAYHKIMAVEKPEAAALHTPASEPASTELKLKSALDLLIGSSDAASLSVMSAIYAELAKLALTK